MIPLRDENPHPPGFKPKLTIALIVINVIVFFWEVAVTGQFFDFSNQRALMNYKNHNCKRTQKSLHLPRIIFC